MDRDDEFPAGNETRNDMSGDAESVVMAGSIGGDVHIGERRRVPGEVPAVVGCFVNREAELARLADVSGHTVGARLLVVEGVRGIGKSALVRRGASLVRDRFPGGQLYHEYARGGAAQRGDPDAAVTSFLRSLGVADHYLPSTYEDRVKEFNRRSRDAAMLVVVEGAEEPAQVRPLVPTAPGSLVLVTSDGPSLSELELDGAIALSLEPLTPEAGRELVLELCGGRGGPADDPATDRLVAACEGLPLALVLLAARIRRQPDADLAALVEELRDEKRRLAAIGVGDRLTLSAAFGMAYCKLSEPAAALYRALGAWPGPLFDTGLAAALAGTDVASVRNTVAELADANLVEPVEPVGPVEPAEPTERDASIRRRHHRFRHPLIRLDARDRAEQEDGEEQRTDRLRRALDHHLTVLAYADRAVMGTRTRVVDIDALTTGAPDPFVGDAATALRHLDHERENLTAAVRAAAEEGLHDHAWRLAELATALYMNIRYVSDWVDTGVTGADSARLVGNAAAEARLRSMVSRPLTDLGRLDRAGEQLDRALEVVAETDDMLLRASVSEFHGRYLDRMDPDRAVTAYDHAQELSERAVAAGDEQNGLRGAALAVHFRGRAHDAAGRHDLAIAELGDALHRFRTLPTPDDRMAARSQEALGRAHHRAGHLREASRELNEAVRALRAGGHSYYEAEARETLAEVLADLGLATEARPHLERVLEVYEAGGSPRVETVRRRLAELGELGG